MSGRNPIEALAHLRHEFGEHGGANVSIGASSTCTRMSIGYTGMLEQRWQQLHDGLAEPGLLDTRKTA
ncbi:MAG: hypothetical protein GWN47_03175 [Woeseiaceae bacterium]|nr:hypothetical protein [Woeseiaceae bacterium]